MPDIYVPRPISTSSGNYYDANVDGIIQRNIYDNHLTSRLFLTFFVSAKITVPALYCVSDTICSLKELSSAVDDILLHRPPEGVADIDAGVDQFRCPEYAWDMIRYLMVCRPTFILAKLAFAQSLLLDCNISVLTGSGSL